MPSVVLGPGLLRFALAWIVLIEHTSSTTFGGFAVYSFFVLSGYWISKAWNTRYSKTANPYLVFMTSRLWRLYPAFLLAIVAAAWLTKTWPVDIGEFSLLGAASLNELDPPSWTLDIEVQFYLLAPILVGLSAHRSQSLLLLAFSLLLAVGALWLDLPKTLVSYLIFFAIGMVAADMKWRPSHAVGLLSLAATIAIPAAIFFSPQWKYVFFSNASVLPHAIYGNMLLALVGAPFTVWVMRFKSGSMDNFLGRMSYTLYLIHWPVVSSGAAYWDFIPAIGPIKASHFGALIAAFGLYLLETPFELARTWFLKQTRSRNKDAPVTTDAKRAAEPGL